MGGHSGRDGLTLPPSSPLRSLDRGSAALVILLRSFGCTFCREAMADVAAVKPALQAAGAQIAFVHAASPEQADHWFAEYGLADVMRVSDPGLAHYRAFGLGRTPAQSLVDPRVWIRGAACALSHGFGVQTVEMMRQLPGVFVIRDGMIVAEFRHSSPADRPDYVALARTANGGR